MKKCLIALTAAALIALAVCAVLFGSGFLSIFDPDISAACVDAIHITDGETTGETIEITDTETIGLITDAVNNLPLAVGRSGTPNGWLYSLSFQNASHEEIFRINVVDYNHISSMDHFYPADTTELINCLNWLFP